MLNSNQPMFVAWGPERTLLYNDAYAEILVAKHPGALGRDFLEVWSEIRSELAPIVDQAYAGKPVHMDDITLFMERRGYSEETHFAFSYTPVRGEDGAVSGFFCPCIEITAQVLAERRQAFWLALDEDLRSLADPGKIIAATSGSLGRHLGVGQIIYADMEPGGEFVTIDREWNDGSIASNAGRHRLDDYGAAFIADLRRGETTEIADVRLDVRTSTRQAPAAEALTGHSLAETQGRHLHNVIHHTRPDGSPYPSHECPIDGVCPGTDRQQGEEVFVHKSGRFVPVAFAASSILDEAGESVGTIVEVQDITDRKATEAELRESESRFRLMADATPQIMWITDAEGRAEFFNRQWTTYTGARFEPKTAADVAASFVHPDDAERTMITFEAARASGNVFEVEHRIRSAAGDYRWFLVRAEPYQDAATGVIVRWFGASVDIHDRKLAEAALRKMNETLESQVQERTAERDRIWRLPRDLMCVAQLDGTLVAVNPAWESLLGWPLEWLTGRNAAEIKHPDDTMRTATELVRLAEGHPSLGFEDRYRHQDGSWRWISWTIEPEGDLIYCIGRDVTAEKARQAELAAVEAARREADALYRAYFENTAEALFVVGVQPDGGFTIEDLNPAHQASVGLPLAEVAGKRIDEALPPATAEAVQKHYRHIVDTGSVYQYREAFDLHGKMTHWDTVLVPVRDNDGRIVRLIGSSRDLTRQLAAEEQLRQAQKMEAMGQLTGGVAHDFNNLLTPIIGGLDMLQRKQLGGEREQRLIGGAMQSAERAKTLVQRLLAFARRQPLQPTAVDVGKLVAGMADLIASTTGPQIKVAVEIASDLPPAKGDPNQLEMALLNLAVNARDAMPDGGTLRISAGYETVDRSHKAKLASGEYICLSVADTGFGMDEATLARAVEPFFSTKGIGKGTGLGLSMVHGLASQLGGALSVGSRPGVGTNVELWLPRSGEPSVAIGGGAAEVASAPAAVGTALLVDDEELVRISTADMLADLGFVVVEASSAEAALALVDGGLSPALLITDHLMPGMTGTDLARELRERRPGMPILLVSGYAEDEGIAPDLPRLTKPFRNDELAASLATLFPTAITEQSR